MLGIVLLSGCHELCETHPHGTKVNVKIIWDKVSRGEAGQMAVCFFPVDGGLPHLLYDGLGHEGGQINLPPGNYHAICFSSGLENVFWSLRDTPYGDFTLYSNRTSLPGILSHAGVRAGDDTPRPEGTETEPVSESPLSVYGDKALDLSFPMKDREYTIEFHPVQYFKKYTVHVRKVTNIQHVRAVSGVLTSLSESYIPSLGRASDTRVSVPLVAAPDVQAGTIDGSLNAFGHIAAGRRFHLAIYFVLNNDTRHYCFRDVTDQVLAAGDADVVPIEIDRLDVPDPNTTSGGGLTPSFEEWGETVDIPIKMEPL